jgi:hypothetical protein
VHTTLVNMYRASLEQGDLLNDIQWNRQVVLRFLFMSKRAHQAPMVTQPTRSSDVHPMADRTSTEKPEPVSNKVSTADVTRLRQSSLKKQRSMLDKPAKTQ